MHTLLIFIYILGGGILAGILSSAASFASLVSYPLLLSVGIPPVYANVTNDAALIWNSIGAVFSSGRELHGHWHEVARYAVFTVLGSAVGCYLLLIFPGKIFEKVVPFFILIAGIMVIVSGQRQPIQIKKRPISQQVISLVLLTIVGIYAGYFGAASGIVVLVLLTYLINDNFLVVNAVKNAVCGLANLTALIIYMFNSHIYWRFVIPMAIGMFIGGYLGPIIVRHVSARLVRIIIAALALTQAAIYFYQAYF